MHVDVRTVVPAEPDRVKAEVMTPRLLRYVSWPLITFDPVHPTELPPTWRVGDYAGLLTVPVWAFAHLLYRWRQLRWRRLARRRFRY